MAEPETITTTLAPDSHHPDDTGVSIAVAHGKGDEGATGVILIGMDHTDAATTTASRRSTSSTSDEDHFDGNPRPSETNDTEPDVDINRDNLHNTEKQEDPREERVVDSPPPSIHRRSHSSSTDVAEANLSIPISIRHRRSTSSSSSSSSSSLHKRPSTGRSKRTARSREISPVDPQDTTPTAVDSGTISQRHSATEFQKFRDELSQKAQPDTAYDTMTTEWQLHPNPHRPGTGTEILRIERTYTPIALPSKTRVSDVTNYDVLIPRFSITYPPILREYGISDAEWSGFIQRVNKGCMEAFDPFRLGNILVNIIAVMSCWLSEWFMPNLTKRVCCIYCPMLTQEITEFGEVY